MKKENAKVADYEPGDYKVANAKIKKPAPFI